MTHRSYLCFASDCPPEDQPWLLSSCRELDADAATKANWKAKWSSSDAPFHFPGQQGTFRDKLLWSKRIKDPDNIMDLGMDRTRPHDEGKMLGEILFDCCQETLRLELLVPRCLLESESARFSLNAVSQAKFMAAAERRQGDGGAKDFAAFRRWLHSCSDTGTLIQEGGQVVVEDKYAFIREALTNTKLPELSDTDCQFVLLASMQVHREDSLDRKLRELMDTLGLEQATIAAPNNTRVNGSFVYSTLDVIRDRIGEMPHFPCASGGSCVACYVQSCVDKPSPTSDGGPAPANPTQEDFVDQVARIAKLSKREYLFVPKNASPKKHEDEDGDDDDDESEEEIVTGDSHYILWLPEGWSKIRKRVSEHFMEGEGETEALKHRINLGTTDGGNLKVSMLEAEFEAFKQSRQLSSADKFCTALALVQSARADSYWMHDNECPDELAHILRDIASHFRTNILKRSDEELGIEAPTPSSPVMRSSRTGLYALLDIYANQLKEGCGSKLNFKPTVPKSSPSKTAAPDKAATSALCKRPAANMSASEPAGKKTNSR